MIEATLKRFVDAVTEHNRLVVLVMIVLTAGMVGGMAHLDSASQGSETTERFPDTTVSETADYVSEQYGRSDSAARYAPSMVYVRPSDGNALSKDTLLGALRYQQAVLEADAVGDATATDGPRSVANLIATQAAGTADATLDEQIAALEATSDETVSSLVRSTLTADSDALAFLPQSYEPGSASAESHRMLFRFEAVEGESPSDAQRVLYETATDREGYFTLGEHASAAGSQQLNANTMALVVPFALVSILGILAFTYRDVVDVVVGMVGVVVSIVWMFGILGWLGIGAGMTMIIGPVLIAGLSIDFGFHVFTRYREARGSGDGIREPMARSMRGVAVALALVTATTAVGFLSNAVNPVDSIRNLGLGITLGVVAAFVIFVTLVPALKVTIDGLLERVGFDRRKRPLGSGAFLRRLLSSSVDLARRAAPLVVVLALLVSVGGAAAWTTLEQESFQQQTEPAAEWKQDLPGPMAWEQPAYSRNSRYVRSSYSAVATDETDRFQILLEGDVTTDGSLDAIADATERPVFTDSRSRQSLASPVMVVRSVADRHDGFAETVDEADTDGDGIPDENLQAVYDHLYEIAPDEARQVIEPGDDGYRSLRVVGPAESAGLADDRVSAVRAAATAIEDGTALRATAVSQATVLESQLDVVTDGVVRVLALALAAVFVGLLAIFWRVHDSATLGVATVVPILMVTGLVVGGMALLDVPLTLVTALLMSLVVGLGIDYNIHVSDRFARELDRGRKPAAALQTAVTGTGGALVGSTLTSAGAFVALLLHPHPQLRSFGTLVVLTLVTALVVSVVVLPSLLVLWARHTDVGSLTDASTPAGQPVPED